MYAWIYFAAFWDSLGMQCPKKGVLFLFFCLRQTLFYTLYIRLFYTMMSVFVVWTWHFYLCFPIQRYSTGPSHSSLQFATHRIFFWTVGEKIQAILNAGFIKATHSTAVSQITSSAQAHISIAKERPKVRQTRPLHCKSVSFRCLHGRRIWMRGASNKESGKYVEIKLMFYRQTEHRPDIFLSDQTVLDLTFRLLWLASGLFWWNNRWMKSTDLTKWYLDTGERTSAKGKDTSNARHAILGNRL